MSGKPETTPSVDPSVAALYNLFDMLDRWRLWHRFTIRQLADKAGVSLQQCRGALGKGNWEKVTMRTLLRVSDVFDMELQFRLVGLKQPSSEDNNGE